MMARIPTAAVLLSTLTLLPGAASARTPPPALTAIRCVPATAKACASGVSVTVGRQIQLRGRTLKAGMRVTFRWPSGALATRLRRSPAGWVARVPAGTQTGAVKVTVTDRAGRRSNALKLRVASSGPTPLKAAPVGTLPGQFTGHGQWIWELPKTEKGDVAAMISRAQRTAIAVVYVKGADGSSTWKQFTPELVAQFHAAGIRVCAWQFVYGTSPVAEADAAIAAIGRGADCFVIDAEGKYEGKYAAAQRYVTKLRAAVGPDYPLGLTSFPYVDYHPRLPYSVFLGPGAAQANLPQVYWKDIGTTVDAASARTFAQNRLYGRPITPLGQTYQAPAADQLRRFRQVWSSYGAAGLSWWDWQETTDAAWSVLAEPTPVAVTLPDPGWPSLGRGARGDQVVWLEQHLAAADPSVTINGALSAADVASLQTFQAARGIAPSGRTDPATWIAALGLQPVAVDWTTQPAPGASGARAARAPEIAEHGAGPSAEG